MIEAIRNGAKKLFPTARVIAGDFNPNALARFVADEFWAMPATNEGELGGLLEGCHRRGVQVVVPTRDSELTFWREHATEFAAVGIHLIASSLDAIRLCLDKLAFAKHGISRGFRFIPASERIDNVNGPRYVVKERFGAGSRQIGLNLSKGEAISHARALQSPIFQPFIEGTEISIDTWADRYHRVKGVVLRRRDMVVDGESQVTTTFRNAEIEKEALKILNSIGLTGPAVMQAIIDPGGHLQVLECNARFGGASTAGIAAGLDPFYWSLLEISGHDVTQYPFNQTRAEIRQIRVSADIYRNGPYF